MISVRVNEIFNYLHANEELSDWEVLDRGFCHFVYIISSRLHPAHFDRNGYLLLLRKSEQ